MKAGGEKGQKFFQENISSYIMVLILSNPLSLIVLKLTVQDKNINRLAIKYHVSIL